MKNFLKYTLATITGIIITSILFFIIMIAGLSAMLATGNKPVSLDENSVLVLKAGTTIPDRGNPNPFTEIDLLNMTFSPIAGLNDILNNIEKASSDKKIKGILIENGLLPPGWATTEEIRNALEKFRSGGKFVISYSDYMLTQEGYYLSTVANKIYINPGSMMDFKGLSGEVIFYKKALDKIGVDVQVIRHGKFKGAVEPFILDELSKENKEQIKDYVGSIWTHVIANISKSRGISEDKLNMMADNLVTYNPDAALENKLVDGLLYRDAMIDTLKALSGINRDDKIHFVSMTKYSKVPDANKKVYVKNRIAVIYASGSIITGKGNDYNIGGNNYAELIRDERLDTTVKAIVFRVNSPGGDAIASEIIWRELDLAAKVKPVVVSMGNYAASGGYFISVPATKIYANPTTISGSIGVFGLIPNAEKLMNQKLGISVETVNTNKNSDFPSIFRPLSIYEKKVMQMTIEQVYSNFVNKVASGRKMTTGAVDSIAQGRVWSGTSARRIGLIDEFGGLKDAIQGAASLAGIETYSIRELPVVEDSFTKLLTGLSGEIRSRIVEKELGESARYFTEFQEFMRLSGIQARLPYYIEIR
jgi:protease IV